MPKSRYNEIYQTLKERIETGDYPFRELIPSENTLVQEFDCSRNTLRRAVQALSAEGYVQSMQGRGVRVIWQKRPNSQFLFGGVLRDRNTSVDRGATFRGTGRGNLIEQSDRDAGGHGGLLY